jgi:Cof subfamily protein (haloacid dehalogenase superfamily)
MRLVITDLDGTLAKSGGVISDRDMKTLHALKGKCLRVIATGRSWFSTKKVVKEDFPIDYLIFSSGAGIVDWKTQKLLISHHLNGQQIRKVHKTLMGLEADFMLHDPIPNNHHFHYRETGRENPDFAHRIKFYDGYCKALTAIEKVEEATQFLVIHPPHLGVTLHEEIKSALTDFSVIRVSSPFDKISLWVEILHPNSKKENAAQWIASLHGINRTHTFALGNEHNDAGMLDWAGAGYAVENAIEELKLKFSRVASNENSGFSEAVEHWLNR